MVKVEVSPCCHTDTGNQRRTQGAMLRKPGFFVTSGFMPDGILWFGSCLHGGVLLYRGARHSLAQVSCSPDKQQTDSPVANLRFPPRSKVWGIQQRDFINC